MVLGEAEGVLLDVCRPVTTASTPGSASAAA